MTVNQKEYHIVKLLGKGKGGYSYLVKDDLHFYTLKQIHHEPCDYYQFENKLESELRDYARLKEVGILMPILIDVDYQQERILKEYIDGQTIMSLVEKDRMKEEYIHQIEQMCSLLYSAHLNIDYYPTNFIVKIISCFTSIMNAMNTWKNGILRIGAANIGKRKHRVYEITLDVLMQSEFHALCAW